MIWPLQIARNLKRRTPFVVELRNIPFRQQEQILFYIADRLPRLLGGAMDARGNGQYLAETARQRYGARIAQVMLSVRVVSGADAAVQGGIRGRQHRDSARRGHPGSTIARSSSSTASRRWRPAPARSDQKARHGDSAMAAALASFASRQDVAEIEPADIDDRGAAAAVMGTSAGRADPFGRTAGGMRFAAGACVSAPGSEDVGLSRVWKCEMRAVRTQTPPGR